MLNIRLGEFSQIEDTCIACTQIKKHSQHSGLCFAPPGLHPSRRNRCPEMELCLTGIIQSVPFSVGLLFPSLMSVRFTYVVDLFCLRLGTGPKVSRKTIYTIGL